jgi:hypothetical protein
MRWLRALLLQFGGLLRKRESEPDNNFSDYFLMSLAWIDRSSTSKIRVALGPI